MVDSSISLRRLVAISALTIIPSFVGADNSAAAVELHSCLSNAGVRSIINSDSTWAKETMGFQKRLTYNPACIAFPESNEDVAVSLSCARNASVKATALGPGHSFQGYGFGNPGNLVINMAAFNSVSYDEASTHLTFGGGTHVGPVMKYLWDTAGRHVPHVRGAHVGVTGSSMGGGYGSTSRHLGTPMDNLVSIDYMLYNGTTIKAEKGSDLFWAAQGAGSSFGIVLSATTKTHKPLYDTAVRFTINFGNVSVETAARALVAIQEYSLGPDCPDELALRWTLNAPPYSSTGYFYGDPTKFDAVLDPLVSNLKWLNNGTTITKNELSFWDMEVSVAGAGMELPNGGSLGGRSFYTQALTTTTDHPLTFEQTLTLFKSTIISFDRTDMNKSGFLDLWGGVSRDIKDEDTAYAHGKNLWLIRWESNSSGDYPEDGPVYMKSLIEPFEKSLAGSGVPLRGFVNYADTELSEEEWSARLYGKNYDRLKQIKKEIDPEGLFISHAQSIPLP
ncbi:unnamed protein product [Clonostachys chloroleuca]|uniref:FAD-binding PCMH-type domain-containing protein n=1 Tax=Clonostachys chloroleuca TaxID=1926264 RepID=A0AA35Q3C4_9HYPO|nr:unnamed protein product [Clonostachys chloroleuca]